MGMLAVGIGSLQVMLDKGQEQDWFASHWIIGLLIAAAVFLTAFIVRELKTAHPVVSLRVFKDRTYSTGVFLMTILGFVLYGSLVLLPIWLQTLLGYPAVEAGIAMAPRGIGSFIGMTVIGRIMHKFDPRKFLALGLLVGAWTLYQLSRLNMDAGYWDFFWPQFVQGMSLAMLFVPLTTITMSNIPREGMGNATSMFNLLRNLGGGIGIAGVSTMVTRFSQKHVNMLGANVTAYSPQTRAMMSHLGGVMSHGAVNMSGNRLTFAAMFGMIEQQATMLSYIDVFQLLALIFLLMIPLVMIMKKPSHAVKPAPGAH
jgi:DHA2 family multidrug resistance protein